MIAYALTLVLSVMAALISLDIYDRAISGYRLKADLVALGDAALTFAREQCGGRPLGARPGWQNADSNRLMANRLLERKLDDRYSWVVAPHIDTGYPVIEVTALGTDMRPVRDLLAVDVFPRQETNGRTTIFIPTSVDVQSNVGGGAYVAMIREEDRCGL